jgi:hypothetical protein
MTIKFSFRDILTEERVVFISDETTYNLQVFTDLTLIQKFSLVVLSLKILKTVHLSIFQQMRIIIIHQTQMMI